VKLLTTLTRAAALVLAIGVSDMGAAPALADDPSSALAAGAAALSRSSAAPASSAGGNCSASSNDSTAGLITGPAAWSPPAARGDVTFSTTLPAGWQADAQSPFPVFQVPGQGAGKVVAIGLLFVAPPPANATTTDALGKAVVSELQANGFLLGFAADELKAAAFTPTPITVHNQPAVQYDAAGITYQACAVARNPDGTTDSTSSPLSGSGVARVVVWLENGQGWAGQILAVGDQPAVTSMLTDFNAMVNGAKQA
jgi:hypothetical protein